MNEHQLPANYRISIKALIRNAEGKILLVKEDPDDWGIPGGGLDHGESIEQALRREMHEELNAEVAEFSPLPVMVDPGFVPEMNRWKLWLTYEVKLVGEPTPGKDVREIGWFSEADMVGVKVDSIETQHILDAFHKSDLNIRH